MEGHFDVGGDFRRAPKGNRRVRAPPPIPPALARAFGAPHCAKCAK